MSINKNIILNKNQLDILERGMVEEAKTGYRMNKGMPYETTSLMMRYLKQQTFPNDYSQIDKETTYEALNTCFGFWMNYFGLGAEVAIEMWERLQAKKLADAEKRCEEYRRKHEAELNALIAKENENENKEEEAE